MSTKLLYHFTSFTIPPQQHKERNKMKSLWVKIKTRILLGNYHCQTGGDYFKLLPIKNKLQYQATKSRLKAHLPTILPSYHTLFHSFLLDSSTSSLLSSAGGWGYVVSPWQFPLPPLTFNLLRHGSFPRAAVLHKLLQYGPILSMGYSLSETDYTIEGPPIGFFLHKLFQNGSLSLTAVFRNVSSMGSLHGLQFFRTILL